MQCIYDICAFNYDDFPLFHKYNDIKLPEMLAHTGVKEYNVEENQILDYVF